MINTVDKSQLSDDDFNRIKDKDHALKEACMSFNRYAGEHLKESAQALDEGKLQRALDKAHKAVANLREAVRCETNINTILVKP